MLLKYPPFSFIYFTKYMLATPGLYPKYEPWCKFPTFFGLFYFPTTFVAIPT